eukprot:6171374-Amphidinium_carterae.4
MHPQAVGIWKSEAHSWRKGKMTLVVDLLMFTEECQAIVHQTCAGVFLTQETVPWFHIVGWFETGGTRNIKLNDDYGFFRTKNSRPEIQAEKEKTTEEPPGTHPGETPGSAAKEEAEETPKEVPREDARAENDTTAEPFQWEGGDKFSGFRGVVEERGFVYEEESENLARKLNEFLERQAKFRPPEERQHEEDSRARRTGRRRACSGSRGRRGACKR